LVFGACDTQPATDVTFNAATLNAKGACSGNMNGLWQYELRRVGGPWTSVGPLHPFACGGSGGETPIQSHRATGLQPNITYQYRIRAWENNSGREYYFDSQGNDRGTNYDSFRTYSESDWSVICAQNPARAGCHEEDHWGGSDGTDSVECEDGATVCSAARQKQCKGKRGNPLNNFFDHEGGTFSPLPGKQIMYGAETIHSWCWKDGKIVRADLSADGKCWTTDYGDFLLWYHRDCRWEYRECTPDLTSCLYRWEAKFSCCKPISQVLPPRVTLTFCLAARVCSYRCGENGAFHSRAILKRQDCPT
jgi:hypothetical protein